jgi:hypothetical protein
MSVILFNKVCLYNTLKDETTMYGQYKVNFDYILINNEIFNLVICKNRPDFYIKFKGKISKINSIDFILNSRKITEFKDISLYFPFEDCDLQLHAQSAIITTMCKDYSHRLDEWIQYNLKLGFSGIVLFNNNENISNSLNEPLEFCVSTSTTEEICKKYKGKVWMVDMPYSPLINVRWDSIQRIALHIGVNAFRNKCRNIATIDSDEFIYFPKNPSIKIEDFLQNHSTITMQSNILTNKNDNDILNNNILQLANYIGENKYTKTILHTDKILEDEFIVTPHEHESQVIMNKDDIIHYHCWMNKRYKYNVDMKFISLNTCIIYK